MVYRVTERPANGEWGETRLVGLRIQIYENADEQASTTVIDDDGQGTVTIEDSGGSVTVPIVDLESLGICVEGAENGDILVWDAVQNCFVARKATEGGGQIIDDGTPDNNPGGTGLDLDGGSF